MLSAGEEASPLNFARDIIKQFWLNAFRLREQQLDPDSDEAYAMTLSRRRLEALPWDQAAPFMDALNPMLSAPEPTHLTPSTPPTRKDPEPYRVPQTEHSPAPIEAIATDDAAPVADVPMMDEYQEEDDLYAMF
jgi:hypothetical protein